MDVSKKVGRVGKRNIWEPGYVHNLKDRITSNIELLDAHLLRIASKDSVKSKDEDDQTLLSWTAVSKSNVAKVEPSLDPGANIKSKDDNYQTPPTIAAVPKRNVTEFKPLLDAVADIESKDDNNQTLLLRAVKDNNYRMVKLLLDAGVDIGSKNDNNQTPLWWAAQHHNFVIVDLLLKAGVDIESKNDNGQTLLWWAAQRGNFRMVRLLLDAGAYVDSKDNNNQTPLSEAARDGSYRMVKLLLDAGACVDSKDNNNQTPLWWAVRYGYSRVVELLLDASANVKSKDSNDQTPTAGPDALREAVGQFDVQAVEDLLTQALIDVAIDDLYWLRELAEMGYGYQDIATLLVDEKKSPWIFIEPFETSSSGVIMDHHQAYCIHQGGNRVTFSPNLVAEDDSIYIGNFANSGLMETDSIKHKVATFCGLAGVVPTSNDRQGWIGSVAFDGDDFAVASVAYELELSTSTVQHYLSRVEAALEQLVDIVSWLQQNGLCCNSFTILKLSAEIGRVELIQVPFSLISLLIDRVSYLRTSDRDREIIDSALEVAQKILDLVYGMERDGTTPSSSNTLDLESAERATVHDCALATQSLCLGLLSYSNAHAGPIKPFFLSRALKRVQLLGVETRIPNKQCFAADLVELTCFGQMIGNAVVAFTCTETSAYTRKYDLVASPEDLIDTWGPGRFIIGRSSTKVDRLYAIEIGGGVIRPTAEDATRFHWEKGILDYEGLSSQFDSHTKIIISATKFNESCPLDPSRSWQVCNPFMENLGTRPDYWRLAEIQAGSQVGQYVMLQFNSTWVKHDGITLKDRQLNAAPETIYLPFLESLLGLQVSLCTGVARRVPVREMLADVMKAYVEKRLPIPTLWNDLLNNHKIVHSFQGPHMETWFQNLSTELQKLVVRIVRYILSILGDTGYNEQRDELVIACPFPEDPFRCFRIPCEGDQHLWARALADSETCATFAYITPKCWDEPNGLNCQQSCVAKWRNRLISLDTAVCQHKCYQPQDQNFGLILKPAIAYWIGKPGSGLKAKVLEPPTQSDMRLSITRSLIPESVLRRISRFNRIPFYRIREKQQNVELNATPVRFLTRPPSPPAC